MLETIHSVSLNDVQKSISVVIVREKINHSAVDMQNYAGWPRTIFLLFIFAFQWLEYETPAQTPSPTPARTPSPTPVPTASPSPTHASRCPSALLSGSCLVSCDSICGLNFHQNYNCEESCQIDMLFKNTVAVKGFLTKCAGRRWTTKVQWAQIVFKAALALHTSLRSDSWNFVFVEMKTKRRKHDRRNTHTQHEIVHLRVRHDG